MTSGKTFFSSRLYNESTFYEKFLSDLLLAENEVLIESPFIASARMKIIYPVLAKLLEREVRIVIVTRDPKEHEYPFNQQSEREVKRFENTKIQTLISKGVHRKLAIIDRKILWEGSLNILSHAKSREIMRRIENKATAEEMLDFLKLKRFL